MQEIWKDISGYEGLYQVSNYGNIKRIYTHNIKNQKIGRNEILNPWINNCGYYMVGLRKNNHKKSFLVHRLVLEMFVDSCSINEEGRHLDGNKLNNNIHNLAWGTRSDNEKDKIIHGRSNRGSRQGNSKFLEIDILDMRYLYKKGWTIREIGKKYNVDYKVVWPIIRYKTWKHLQ